MAERLRLAVIGDPIAHSLSPAMHHAALTALGFVPEYSAIHVCPAELADFVARARYELDGFNATVPHKEKLIPLLDEIAPAARVAGSVNTVTRRGDRLYGDSTDGHGLEVAIHEAFDLDLQGRRFVFLGAGGTVHAVAPHFLRRGAAAIAVVNRTLAKAADMLAKFATDFPDAELLAIAAHDQATIRTQIAQATVVIQATSLGLRDNDPNPLADNLFLPDTCYFDTIYRDTAFLAAARNAGCRHADGLAMLLHQGAASFRIWPGQAPPLAIMRQALLGARHRRKFEL